MREPNAAPPPVPVTVRSTFTQKSEKMHFLYQPQPPPLLRKEDDGKVGLTDVNAQPCKGMEQVCSGSETRARSSIELDNETPRPSQPTGTKAKERQLLAS